MNAYYISAYKELAEVALKNSSGYHELGSFAILLSEKANFILQQASVNGEIDSIQLQKDLFQIGKEYVQEFSKKHSRIKW